MHTLPTVSSADPSPISTATALIQTVMSENGAAQLMLERSMELNALVFRHDIILHQRDVHQSVRQLCSHLFAGDCISSAGVDCLSLHMQPFNDRQLQAEILLQLITILRQRTLSQSMLSILAHAFDVLPSDPMATVPLSQTVNVPSEVISLFTPRH